MYEKHYNSFTGFWEVNFVESQAIYSYVAKFYNEEHADLFLEALENNG